VGLRSSISVVVIAALLAGCSEPKLNAASETELKASIQEVKDSLDPSKQQQFNSAIVTIMGSGMDLGAVMRGEQSAEDITQGMLARLDGKTADEVIAESERIIREREARQREQALQEIKDLEEKKAAAAAAQSDLEKFQVTKSRLYKRDDGFMKKPIIELSVVNATDKAVSRVFFEGVVASPGRSVPWVEDTFNYSIPGGIEPGESADWALAPNMFSAWATEVPADAILTLKAYKLEGPGYELPEKSFSDNDKERLDTLKSRYPD
jgi:PBP1b-binding outer membrane lipoprotein LpoB